jgi:hypothetical protein
MSRFRFFMMHDVWSFFPFGHCEENAPLSGSGKTTVQIFGDDISCVQVKAACRIRAAVPIDNQPVAAQGDHFRDLIGNDRPVVLVVAHVDVLGIAKPRLVVKQDLAVRTGVEHGVKVREIHVARDRIHHDGLSFGVGCLRIVAAEG